VLQPKDLEMNVKTTKLMRILRQPSPVLIIKNKKTGDSGIFELFL